MNLGNKIKSLRLKAGVTQEMIANELGVSCQSISKWENNVCAPDINMLPQISEYFGVTIDELFDITVDQKLHRIENMLDFEDVISEDKFRDTESFLQEQLSTYDKTHEDRPNGRIQTFLAHLYHHRMTSDGKKVSYYGRAAMKLQPDLKENQWLLQKSEGATIRDWNCRNHHQTIMFYKEQIRDNPDIPQNYLYLLDNLLSDHRISEAKEYLKIYSLLKERIDFQVLIYKARIYMTEHKPEQAYKIITEAEQQFPNNGDVMFHIAGFYADECKYEQALAYYEKSYELDLKPRYNDALRGQAMIYEILEKYENAVECWKRIIENLEEEWGITEGAPILEAEQEIQRLKKLGTLEENEQS